MLLLGLLAAALTAFFLLDLQHYLSWEYLKSQRDALQARVEEQLLLAAVIYFLVYVALTAVSIPFGTAVTLIGGFLLGRWLGLVVVSFASTTGATLAFLSTRYLFRDWLQRRWGQRLDVINRGLETDGAYYLFTLRLVPLFPFFVINAAMGVTNLPVWTYWWVSQLGMLPATFIYVNAGTELGRIGSPGDILSLPVLISLALLGIVPLGLRKGVQWWKQRGG
jgi:uncharacterized membrane protein YdjX (TVP38/TMEM64 family)